jgi:hypothetical protein
MESTIHIARQNTTETTKEQPILEPAPCVCPGAGPRGSRFSTAWKKFSRFFHTMEKCFPQCGKRLRRHEPRFSGEGAGQGAGLPVGFE